MFIFKLPALDANAYTATLFLHSPWSQLGGGGGADRPRRQCQKQLRYAYISIMYGYGWNLCQCTCLERMLLHLQLGHAL